MSEDKKIAVETPAAAKPAAKAKAASKPAAKKATEAKPAAKPSTTAKSVPAKPAAKPATAAKAVKKTAPKKAVRTPSKPGVKKPTLAATPAETAPKATPEIRAAAQKPAPRLKIKASNPMKDTLENMTAAGNEALKEGFEKTLTAVNEANSFHKENVDAVIASATAAGKGVEAINTNAVSYAKSAMEEGVAVAKKISSAKSVQEIMEIQTDFAKSAMDSYLAEINKTTDLFASAMKDSVKPLNDRVSASVDLAQTLR